MEILRARYEENKKYFENPLKYLRGVKKILKKNGIKEFRIFLFGSIVRGDYSIGLSDIDVLIVSDKFKDKELRRKVYLELGEKYFAKPFEFHLATPEQFNSFYSKMVGKDIREIRL